MKEIVILSGKGGTGKTTMALNILNKYDSKVAGDADVDAADMFIMLGPEIITKGDFMSNGTARINTDKCAGCGICAKLCRFGAITCNPGEKYVKINEISCEGCGLCEIACPEKAARVVPEKSGEWYISKTAGGTFLHARLIPGSENSGRLVAKVKESARNSAAKEKADYIILDGPPGIGCPAIAAMSGADFVMIVTEPTMSGVHDLKRIQGLAGHFKIKTGIVVNKSDINEDITKEIEKYCAAKNIPVLGKIVYDKCLNKAINQKKLPYTECGQFRKSIDEIYGKLDSLVKN